MSLRERFKNFTTSRSSLRDRLRQTTSTGGYISLSEKRKKREEEDKVKEKEFVPKKLSDARKVALAKFGIRDSGITKMSVPEILKMKDFGAFKSDVFDDFVSERKTRSKAEYEELAQQLYGGEPLHDMFGNVNAQLNHKIPKELGGTEDFVNLDFRKQKLSFLDRLFKKDVSFTAKQQDGRVLIELENIRKYKKGELTQGQAISNILAWDEWKKKSDEQGGVFESTVSKMKGNIDGIKDFFTKFNEKEKELRFPVTEEGVSVFQERAEIAPETLFVKLPFISKRVQLEESGKLQELFKEIVEAPESAIKALFLDVPEVFRTGTLADKEFPDTPEGEKARFNYLKSAIRKSKEAVDAGMDPTTAFFIYSLDAITDMAIVAPELKRAFSVIKNIKVTSQQVSTLTKADLQTITRGAEFVKQDPTKLALFRKATDDGINFTKALKETGEISIKTGQTKTLGEVISQQYFRLGEAGFAKIPGKSAPIELQPLVENIRSAKISKQDFLEQFSLGLKAQNLTNRDTAINTLKEIESNGLTPESFYDEFISGIEAPKVVEPLVEEARKYKTVEEFVKAQEVLYHGGSKIDSVKVGKSNFGKTFYMSDNATYAKSFGGNKSVVNEMILDKSANLADMRKPSAELVSKIESRLKNDNAVFSDSQIIQGIKDGKAMYSELQEVKTILRKLGYDGQITSEVPWAKNIGVWNQNLIKTKSQLTDIFIKAKEKPVGIPGEKGLKKVGLEKPSVPLIKKKETTLLKEKLRQQAKASRIGKRIGVKESRVKTIEEIKAKQELSEFLKGIKQDISSAFKEKKLSDVKFLEEIQKGIDKGFRIARGRQRSTIAFVRELGEFNQTVINEVKREVGVDKPLRQLTSSELNQVLIKIKERLSFKRKRGFKPSKATTEKLGIKSKETKLEITDNVYSANIEAQKDVSRTRTKDTIKQIRDSVDKTLGIISSRLADIDPSLRVALRRFIFNTNQITNKDLKASKVFLEKLSKMPKDMRATFDFAAKNGDVSKQAELAKEFGFEKELSDIRVLLDTIYGRANNVGFDIGYRKAFFPRIVKDTKGFVQFFSEGKTEVKSIIDEAIKRKEMDLGRALSVDEKAYLINNMIRGYSGGQITLSAIGNMKDRVIDFVTPEMNKFYFDTSTSLVKYINSVNNAIEARKFFGKSRIVDKKVDQFNNLDDSIGAYIFQLLSEGKITPKQEIEVREILNAFFGEKGTNGVVSLYKNLSYIDVMGSPLNTLTQIGDLAFPLYNILVGKTGAFETGNALIRTGISKSKITKEDVGIERIAIELEDNSKSANLVDTVFKLIGLTKIDTMGKETLINPIIARYQKLGKKPTTKFEKEMKLVFEDEASQVMLDLKSGEITENVKFLAFYKLLDFQPVAKSEVPQRYLTGGNLRILYQLKTWTLKMFDVYRNEAFRTMKTNKIQGIRNMILLSMALVLMNATADELKDLLIGRKTSLKDRMIDNIAKLIGFSRYSINQISRDGLGSAAIEQVIPPTNFVDNVTKDTVDLYKDWDTSVEVSKMRSIKSIPLIGKLYYYWFGKGTSFKEKGNLEIEAEKEFKRINKLPQAEAIVEFEKLDDDIKKKVRKLKKDFDLGITDKDKKLKALGVTNGERAKAIVRMFNKLKTDKEKADLWSELTKKKILTKEVKKQVKELLAT